MRDRLRVLALVVVLSLLASGATAAGAVGSPAGVSAGVEQGAAGRGLQSRSALFVENVGQFAEGARFQVRGGDRTIWLAEDAIWVTAVKTFPHPPSPPSHMR